MANKNNNKNLKAYEDIDFLKQDVCRPVRLQLELLKPDVIMEREKIISTIVIMGSARQPSPEEAKQRKSEAEAEVAANPGSEDAKRNLRFARQIEDQSRYYTMAREFAALVSREARKRGNGHYVVTTGGGGGIMEAGNRGAADEKAKSIGLNISLPFEQIPNPYITDELSFIFHYFSIRKMHFMMRASALVAFPGGFGTMDEVFETLTLIQTKKIQPFPVILFGQSFWEEIVNWEKFKEWEVINPEDLDLFKICDSAEEGWNHIRHFWEHKKWDPRGNIE